MGDGFANAAATALRGTVHNLEDRIAKLEAENARYRQALQKIATPRDHRGETDNKGWTQVVLHYAEALGEHVDTARAALAGEG